jgi:hypothetical protein
MSTSTTPSSEPDTIPYLDPRIEEDRLYNKYAKHLKCCKCDEKSSLTKDGGAGKATSDGYRRLNLKCSNKKCDKGTMFSKALKELLSKTEYQQLCPDLSNDLRNLTMCLNRQSPQHGSAPKKQRQNSPTPIFKKLNSPKNPTTPETADDADELPYESERGFFRTPPSPKSTDLSKNVGNQDDINSNPESPRISSKSLAISDHFNNPLQQENDELRMALKEVITRLNQQEVQIRSLLGGLMNARHLSESEVRSWVSGIMDAPITNQTTIESPNVSMTLPMQHEKRNSLTRSSPTPTDAVQQIRSDATPQSNSTNPPTVVRDIQVINNRGMSAAEITARNQRSAGQAGPPQQFQRIFIKFSSLRGETRKDRMVRARQYFNSIKISNSITDFGPYGRNRLEVYVCDEKLETFIGIINKHRVVTYLDLDPNNFESLKTAEDIKSAKDAAVRRIGFLLCHSRSWNHRLAIIKGYDREIVDLALEHENSLRLKFNRQPRPVAQTRTLNHFKPISLSDFDTDTSSPHGDGEEDLYN